MSIADDIAYVVNECDFLITYNKNVSTFEKSAFLSEPIFSETSSLCHKIMHEQRIHSKYKKLGKGDKEYTYLDEHKIWDCWITILYI